MLEQCVQFVQNGPNCCYPREDFTRFDSRGSSFHTFLLLLNYFNFVLPICLDVYRPVRNSHIENFIFY